MEAIFEYKNKFSGAKDCTLTINYIPYKEEPCMGVPQQMVEVTRVEADGDIQLVFEDMADRGYKAEDWGVYFEDKVLGVL